MTVTVSGDSIDTDVKLAALFKQAMRRLATTVTIITTRDANAGPLGMTATATTSVCLNPPAVLVCVNREAGIHGALAPGRSVIVNILSGDHGDLSLAFGGRLPSDQRFGHGAWMYDEGPVPYLGDAQANLFCTVDAMHAYGTHDITICRVDRVRLKGEAHPLIFGDGRFRLLA